VIQVRYFASLREQLGRAGDFADVTSGTTVGELWARTTGNQPLPNNTLVAVNHEYSTLDRTVQEGDEVAFFPPVTGG